jgi:hypothetical protein
LEADMSRIRSPNYPAISLAEAVERAGSLFAKEHQHSMSRDVALKGLGYSGANGASLSAISALRKYGLLSKKGEDYKITERAIAILHPHSAEEKAEALSAAAREPSLFSELLGHFQGVLPSDDNLRSYLVRQGFSQSALGGVIQSFRDTMALVSPEAGDYSGQTPTSREPAMTPATNTAPARQTISSSILPAGEPYRVSIGPGGLQGTFNLQKEGEADDLIRAIQAWKLLLRPIGESKAPDHDEAK